MNSVLTCPIASGKTVRWIVYGALALTAGSVYFIYIIAEREVTKQAMVADWPGDFQSSWERELNDPESPEELMKPFTIMRIGYSPGELVATCGYRNTDSTHGISVHGMVDRNGAFWSKVTLQVANKVSNDWKTIGQSPSLSGVFDSRVMLPNETLVAHVDLNVYRPVVEKYKYGRLVSESGASEVFELGTVLRRPPKPTPLPGEIIESVTTVSRVEPEK